jgi:hypothetical protein
MDADPAVSANLVLVALDALRSPALPCHVTRAGPPPVRPVRSTPKRKLKLLEAKFEGDPAEVYALHYTIRIQNLKESCRVSARYYKLNREYREEAKRFTVYLAQRHLVRQN